MNEKDLLQSLQITKTSAELGGDQPGGFRGVFQLGLVFEAALFQTHQRIAFTCAPFSK
jgi:hypothetical protein